MYYIVCSPYSRPHSPQTVKKHLHPDMQQRFRQVFVCFRAFNATGLSYPFSQRPSGKHYWDTDFTTVDQKRSYERLMSGYGVRPEMSFANLTLVVKLV